MSVRVCVHGFSIERLTDLFSVRLQLVSGASSPPAIPINVSIFTLPPKSAEISTSGAYSNVTSGVVTGRVRLKKGEYTVVGSTYSPGQEEGFVMNVYGEGRVEVVVEQ